MKKDKIIKYHIDDVKQKFYILSFQKGEYIVTVLKKKSGRVVQHFFQGDEKKANNYFEKLTGGNNDR